MDPGEDPPPRPKTLNLPDDNQSPQERSDGVSRTLITSPTTYSHVLIFKDESAGVDGGEGSEVRTPSKRLRDKVSYYESVWTSGSPQTADDVDGAQASSSMGLDIAALEERLEHEKRQRLMDNTPKIEIKLRHTPVQSPRPPETPTKINLNINLRSVDRSNLMASPNDSYTESVERVFEEGETRDNSRVFKYEKVILRKSVKEVSVESSSNQSVIWSTSSGTRSHKTSIGESSDLSREGTPVRSQPLYGGHSNRARSPAFLDKRSHSTADELFYKHKNDGSNSFHKVMSGSGIHHYKIPLLGSGSRSGSNQDICYSVADGNRKFYQSRQTTPDNLSSEGENQTSTEWYHDYKTQSFQSTGAKMEFVRSNSQYDTHIKEMRGE